LKEKNVARNGTGLQMKARLINDAYILTILTFVTIVLRFPSFFPSSINWDESTYILMGQSILDGNLPYTELWDNKPPLLFFVFSVIIAIGGKNIFFIRIVGSIFLSFSSFFVYQSGKYFGSKLTGLIAAILFVVMTGELGGKAVMSEIIASFPLTLAFLIMLRQKKNNYTYAFFSLGCLLSIATLIRLNLAYLVLVIFIYYILIFAIERPKRCLVDFIAILFGFMLPILLVIIPYIITNNLQILYKSVIEAPFNYSSSQLSRSDVTSTFITQGLIRVNCILWVGFFGGFFLTFRPLVFHLSLSKSHNSRPLIILLLWLIAIAFSIVSSGNIYSHYIIQILPFMTIVSATFFSSQIFYKIRYILLAILAVGLFDIAKPFLGDYKDLLTKLNNGISLENDEGYQLANFLRKANPHKEAIYLMDFHIAYWLTDCKPISKIVTHPSNINQNSLLKVAIGEDATPKSELHKILNQKPLFIIKRKDVWYFDSRPDARNLLLATLNRDYSFVAIIDNAYVYKRRDPV
jgi:4-amino-4-deoxy-L-arabinose transferase-like glycosyltransferase